MEVKPKLEQDFTQNNGNFDVLYKQARDEVAHLYGRKIEQFPAIDAFAAAFRVKYPSVQSWIAEQESGLQDLATVGGIRAKKPMIELSPRVKKDIAQLEEGLYGAGYDRHLLARTVLTMIPDHIASLKRRITDASPAIIAVPASSNILTYPG